MSLFDNIFVLSTGRCGSTTFYEACRHITNYSAGHESRSRLLGALHFDYGKHHIEVDNRLSWMLGRLDLYMQERRVLYVWLHRNRDATAKSFYRRWTNDQAFGVVPWYHAGVLMRNRHRPSPAACADYVDTVTHNIRLFLDGGTGRDYVRIDIDHPGEGFGLFWNRIHARGDLALALAEFKIRHNAGAYRQVSAVCPTAEVAA